MSAISEQVRAALYAKLNVSGVTSLVTGVHYETGAGALPYLVFNRQAPGRPVRTFGQTLIAEDDLWLIKSYADEDSSATKSPQGLNAEILIAAETAIGNSLTAVGGTWLVERYSDVLLPTEEKETDKPVYGSGFLLRVVTSAIEDDTVVTYLGDTVTYLGDTVTYAG